MQKKTKKEKNNKKNNQAEENKLLSLKKSSRLKQINKQLFIINKLAKALTSRLSVKEICDIATKEISRNLALDAVMIFLHDNNDLLLCSIASKDNNPKPEEIPIHIKGECLCGIASLNAKPVFSIDINRDKRCTWKECKKAGFKSFSAIPLVYGGEELGILGIASKKEKDFRQSYSFIKTISDQLSVSLNNAKQFEKLNAYSLKLEQEIASHKITEQKLRDSEEKYRLVVENANDAIFIIQDGIIKFPNRRLAEFSGYSKDELTKVPFTSFVHEDDREMVLERYKKRIKGENVPATYTFRGINKKGEIVIVEITAMLIEWEGKPATLNFLRDITQQKKLEEQLFQSQKMETIGTLAGGIAHNFNNLLMGILGNTSLMLMKVDALHPFYDKLKAIERLVEDGADLTRQLIGFARGGKYNVKPLDINKLIKDTSEMFGMTRKDITIYKNLEENINTVEADKSQIEQVLLNIYINAWQAMPSGGNIYIETKNISINEEESITYNIKPGEYIKISITDTGIGMDEATKQRVFEPFFTTRGLGEGNGLGLASAYGIIKNHGGTINVYSEKGHGATFSIYLPALEKKAVTSGQPQKSLIYGHETLLLIDDDIMNIESLKGLLEEFGYKIMTAQSGKEGIEIFKRYYGDIQLVILDMILPEMSGGEILRKLQEINKNVRVLLSSGYCLNGETENILKMGCKGFIQKPFKIDELSYKIREALK